MEGHPFAPEHQAAHAEDVIVPPPPRSPSAKAYKQSGAGRLSSVEWLSDDERRLADDLPAGPLIVGLERRLAGHLGRLESKVDLVVCGSERAERRLAVDLPVGPLVVGLERRLGELLARLESKVDLVVGGGGSCRAGSEELEGPAAPRQACPQLQLAGAPDEVDDEGQADDEDQGAEGRSRPVPAKAAPAGKPAQRQRTCPDGLSGLLAEADGEGRAEGGPADVPSPLLKPAQRQRTCPDDLAGLLAEVDNEDHWAEGAGRRGRQELVEPALGQAPARRTTVRRKLTRKPTAGEAGRFAELLAEVDGEARAQGTRGSWGELREAARGRRTKTAELVREAPGRQPAPADAAPPDGRPQRGGSTVLVGPDPSRHGSMVLVTPDPSLRKSRPTAPASDSPTRRPTPLGDESTSTVTVQQSPRGSEWAESSKASNTHIRKWNMSSKLTKGELVLKEIEKADLGGRRSSAKPNRPSQFSVELDKRWKLLKHADTIGRLHAVSEHGLLGRVVASAKFDFAITVVVLLNALLIGAQVQHNAVSDESVQAFEVMEYSCTAIFTLELCARLCVHRWDFFTNAQERLWNVFDLFLVGLCLVDAGLVLGFGTQGGDAGLVGKVGRTIRLFRIMRIIRVVRKLTQLRVMLHMIISSLQSLFWVLVIMVGLIYTISVVLTQGATEYLKGPNSLDASEEYKQVLIMYGSLFDTMYTLFQCMSGGISWGLASQPLRGPGWMLEAIVISYVFFMVFAVSNIVNGIFVDGAIELSKRDRGTMMQKYLEEHADKERHAIELLTLMDKDGDQEITFQEFVQALEEQEVRDYISALEVEVTDAKVFFQMLDRDGNGTVDILEFTSGMRKFRGEAKSVDIHMMLHQNKQLFKLVSCLVGTLWEECEWQDDEVLPSDD